MKPAILVILSVVVTGCTAATHRRVFDQETPKVVARAEAYIRSMEEKNYKQAWTYLGTRMREDTAPSSRNLEPGLTTEQYYFEYYNALQLVWRQIGPSKAKWISSGQGPFRQFIGLIETPVEIGQPASGLPIAKVLLETYWHHEFAEEGKNANWFLVLEKMKK